MIKRFVLILVAAAICAAPLRLAAQEGEQPGDDDKPRKVDADTELLDMWWAVCRMVHQGEPWADCRDSLAAGLEEYAGSKHARACRRLVESFELATARTSDVSTVDVSTIDDHSPIDELIRALPAARVGYAAILMPYQYHATTKRFEWDDLATEAGMENDPAVLLYRKGRAALPALVESLDDRTATRTVISDQKRFRYPQVYLVGDVALALVEGISGCSFRSKTGQGAMVSAWPDEQRRETIDAVRTWWSATQSMTPPESALWQVRNSLGLSRERTIRSMLLRGWSDAALSYLSDNYRDGDTINYNLAVLTLKAGSRLPLDFIHERVAAGSMVDRTMVRLIAAAGEPVDFSLLSEAIDATSNNNDRETVRQLHLIVHELAGLEDRSTIPVMVAVIERELFFVEHGGSVSQSEAGGYLDVAALHVQTLSGVNFGFDEHAPEGRRLRAYRDIVEWWRREGCGAYGFAQTMPLAPGGIR